VKLSFIPADLHLSDTEDGQFVVSIQGREVFRSPNRRKALAEFNTLRVDLEARFPAHDISPEERRELLQRFIADALVKHNSLRPEQKKSAARSTRTFA
jgi:hypothetical protein